MHKKYTTIFTALSFFFLIFASSEIFSYPNGITGYTLKTSTTGCGTCHGTHGDPSSLIQVTISGPQVLTVNQTQSYTVTISGGSGSNVGTDIAVSSGILNILDNNLKIQSGELTHTSPKSFSGGQYVFHFNYTAPSTPGLQTIYANGVSKKREWNFANNFPVTVNSQSITAASSLVAVFSNSPNKHNELTWNDNSNNELGFSIERKISASGTFQTIGMAPQNSNLYIDSAGIGDTTEYFYRVQAFNTDTTSDYSNTASVLTPVPVELIAFTANTFNNSVTLNWSTASESNNSGFEIERKSADNWNNIGFVEGKGTTTELNIYQFIDDLANLNLGERIFYRLKQVDYSGEYKYSNVFEVQTSGLIPSMELSQNYPNPFNPTTVIRFTVPAEEFVSLKVFNSNGEEVSTLLDSRVAKGKYSIQFDGSNLSSGIYYYRIESDNLSLTKKMILIK